MKITVSYHNLRGSEFIVPQIVRNGGVSGSYSSEGNPES